MMDNMMFFDNSPESVNAFEEMQRQQLGAYVKFITETNKGALFGLDLFKQVNFSLSHEFTNRINKLAVSGLPQCTWHGKLRAWGEAQTPQQTDLFTTGVRSSENAYIVGDGIDICKNLCLTHKSLFDIIYLDAPAMLPGGSDRAEWCSELYQRLITSHDLLCDDGIILVPTDRERTSVVRSLLQEVYGEENWVADYQWVKVNKTREAPALTEDILCFAKQKSCLRIGRDLRALINEELESTTELRVPVGAGHFPVAEKAIINADHAIYVKLSNDIIIENNTNQNEFTMTYKFTWDQSMLDKQIRSGAKLYFPKNTLYPVVVSTKDLVGAGRVRTLAENGFIFDSHNGIESHVEEVRRLNELGLGRTFTYPKPASLIKALLNMHLYCKKEALVLDLCASTGNVGKALCELNEYDGGSRRFMCIQGTDVYDSKSEAYRAGYDTKDKVTRACLANVVREAKHRGTNAVRHVQFDTYYAVPREMQSQISQ